MIEDAQGNRTASTAAVTLTANNSGALTGTTTVNAFNGLATFSSMTLSGLIGTYALVATSGSLTQTTTSNISLTSGAAAQLVFSTQPGNAQSGITMTAFTDLGVGQWRQPRHHFLSAPITLTESGVTLKRARGLWTCQCIERGRELHAEPDRHRRQLYLHRCLDRPHLGGKPEHGVRRGKSEQAERVDAAANDRDARRADGAGGGDLDPGRAGKSYQL